MFTDVRALCFTTESVVKQKTEEKVSRRLQDAAHFGPRWRLAAGREVEVETLAIDVGGFTYVKERVAHAAFPITPHTRTREKHRRFTHF